LIMGFGAGAARLDFSEPDNTMRLVQVRDLLGGQGWFDDIQRRLNPPEGVASHWARWIDAAIAAPIALLTPIVGAHAAEVFVAFAWPLGLLAMFMMLVSRVCRELGGEAFGREAAIAGPIVAALAFPAIEKFAPGSFDHHNVELIFAFAAMLGLMRMSASPRTGAAAGLALAAALATAAEALPQVAAGVAAAGLLWLFNPTAYRRGLFWFGVALAGGSLIFFLALVPPARWGVHVMDTMSPAFLGIGLASGLVSMALGSVKGLSRATPVQRSGAAAAVGVMALGVLLVLCPELAGGGYSALSNEMKSLWLPQISETRTLLQVGADSPGLMLGLAGSAVAGLVFALIYLRKRPGDANAWIALAFLLAGCGVLAWQIRGAAFATAFAVPFGAWAVVAARRKWQEARGPRGLLVFAGVCALSMSAAWGALGGQIQARLAPAAAMADYSERRSSADACLTNEAVAALNRAPPGVIVNPFVSGPAILLNTPHSVMAAPYHRDGGGITLMMNAMRADPEAARAMLVGSPADYVLVCAALPETSYYADHPLRAGADPNTTLSDQLGRGQAPAWLRSVDIGDTPLKLYRIVRD
jgi:hypothetical protein